MKEIAILSGGDWFDASVEHIQIPDSANIGNLYSQYKESEYSAYWNNGVKNELHLNFTDYLKKYHGAMNSEVEIFEEYDI